MPITDILRKLGKPTETSELAKKAAEELDISVRHAYRKIKKAWKTKEIRKVPLPDRSVLCLLPEWPLPGFGDEEERKQILPFEDAFKYECFKTYDAIVEENINGDSLKAFQRAEHLIEKLPPEAKNKLKPHHTHALQLIKEILDLFPAHLQVKVQLDEKDTLKLKGLSSFERPLVVPSSRYTSNPILQNARIREVVKELLGKISETLHEL